MEPPAQPPRPVEPPWRDLGPPRLGKEIAAELSFAPIEEKRSNLVPILVMLGLAIVLIGLVGVLVLLLLKKDPKADLQKYYDAGIAALKEEKLDDAKKFLDYVVQQEQASGTESDGRAPAFLALTNKLIAIKVKLDEKDAAGAQKALNDAEELRNGSEILKTDMVVKVLITKYGKTVEKAVGTEPADGDGDANAPPAEEKKDADAETTQEKAPAEEKAAEPAPAAP